MTYCKVFVLFYDYRLERTIFIRKRYSLSATNYIRLSRSVDQSDLNELMTQRPAASLTDAGNFTGKTTGKLTEHLTGCPVASVTACNYALSETV